MSSVIVENAVLGLMFVLAVAGLPLWLTIMRPETAPLVKQASVRKLYPNHLVIDLVERAPYALWQKDGTVSVVKETSAGKFETIQTVKTLVGAKTIAIDAKTHQVLLPCQVPTGKGMQTFGIAVVGVDAAK